MKKQIIIGLSLLVFGFIQAQKTENYLHFNIGVGDQNLSYKLQNGIEKSQFGYTINAAYTYFFTSHWGLQTGLGIQSYGALSTLNYLSSVPNVIDAVGDSYEFRDNYKNWQEKQQVIFIDIPLEAQYRHCFNTKLGLLASAGVKMSIPLQASYKTVGGEMVTTGYYSKWNIVLSDLPQHGFSTYTNSYNGNLAIKPACSAIADLGGLYKLSENLDLYLGGYINYGLNNIISADSKLVYQPNAVYNGFFSSDQVKKVLPIAVGVKVGVYWKLKNRRQKEGQDIIPVRSDLNNQKQDGHQLLSDNEVAINDSNKINIRNSEFKIPNNKLDLSTNSIIKDSLTKIFPKQESMLSDNSILKAKKIAASMNFNLEPSSVLQRLNIDAETMSKLSDILKVDPNAILYILCQSDSSSIAKVVNRKTDVSTNELVDGLTLDTLSQNTNSSSTVFPIGFPTILKLLSADIEAVKSLSTILKAHPNLSPYILSQHDFTSVNVEQTTQTKITPSVTDEATKQIDSDGDGVPDYLDRCPSVAGVKSNQGCPEIKNEVRTLFRKALTGIQFETGMNTIMKKSYSILDQISLVLIKNPNYSIEVQGHADSAGNPQSNKLLSELRAFAVRSYLIKKGVEGKRITAIGFGDTMPISTNRTPQGRALNRRVEFVVVSEEVSLE